MSSHNTCTLNQHGLMIVTPAGELLCLLWAITYDITLGKGLLHNQTPRQQR
jgi:hypothetical protein